MTCLVYFLLYCAVSRLGLSKSPDWLEKSIDAWGSDGSFDIKHLLCNKKKSHSKDISYTVWYKIGQIREDEFHAHLLSIKAMHGTFSNKVSWRPGFFSGYVLPGDVTNEVLEMVRSFTGIHSVGRTKYYSIRMAAPQDTKLGQVKLPWGLDRINQKRLPLDSRYHPVAYNGTGSNVFIVDTGIDTDHEQFSVRGNNKRIVKNLFDVADPDQLIVPTNNDNVGHGTHVAGTIGGNDVGVSPGANLYGVRVLDENGSGDEMSIAEGLNFVRLWYLQNNLPPSVISMSLGGSCGSLEKCLEDILVNVVEELTSIGIVVVTAAGNGNCDSCLESPAFAPSSITVGASSETDEAAFFSDFGKCIDIFAPGINVVSACARVKCGNHLNETISFNGTSMACPHVSGVVAQLLEAYPAANVTEITNKLMNDASMLVLDIKQDRPPAVTRNLLLQVPLEAPIATRKTGRPELRDLGQGCEKTNKCSGNGFCQEGRCLCDGLAWGTNCSAIDITEHCDPVNMQ